MFLLLKLITIDGPITDIITNLDTKVVAISDVQGGVCKRDLHLLLDLDLSCGQQVIFCVESLVNGMF